MTHARIAMGMAAIALLATAMLPGHAAHALGAPLALQPCDAETHLHAPRFSAGSLREGRFVYRESNGAKDTSSFTLEIRRSRDDTWRFTGEGSGQRWEATTDSAFHAKSAMLSMTRHGRPYEFRLRYSGDSVFALVTRADSASSQIRESAAEVMRGTTIDQRIDWASLMASDLPEGERAAYAVYDPATGSSVLTASASEGPTLTGPDGARATTRLDYTICKAGKSESYTVFATKGRQRMMLREDMRGDIVTELVRVEP